MSAAKAGCYAHAPQGSPSSEQLQLPLKSLSYDVELADSLAFLQLQQIYLNKTSKTLDVQYIFPANPSAAIVSFQICFGGKISKGVIKSKEDAQKQFQQHKEDNRGVGFGGYNSNNSKDIMKIKLGNIYPNQQIKVRISYVHTVSLVLNTFFQFRLPTTITPRYINSIPADQLVFQKQHHGKYDKQVPGYCYWSIRLRIKSSKQLQSVFSKTHSVNPNFKMIDKNLWDVDINEKEMLPNKDLSLCYTFKDLEKPSVLLGEIGSQTQAVVSFVPKFCSLNINDAMKYAMKDKEEQMSMSKVRAQYIFIIDRSGSMDGSRIAKAKEALIVFLKSLPEHSYFNIISFGSFNELLHNKSQKYQQSILQKTIESVNQMGANFGGTQILTPLKKCLSSPPIEGYPRHIFLLTDGAVSNTADIIRYVSQHTQKSRVHTIGIGDGCSQDLISGCAKQGKGYSVFITDEEDPSCKIVDILDRSLSPVIMKTRLQFDHQLVEKVVPNPQKCPYILKNEIANFYFTFKGKLTKPTTLKINYTDSQGRQYLNNVLIDPLNTPFCPYINKMVDSIGIDALYAAYRYNQPQQEFMFNVKQGKQGDLAKQIVNQSIEKQILTDLTAFICVDQSLSDQVLKAKQKGNKESIRINPLNPVDHIPLKVTFGGFDQDSDCSSEVYIDECAIQDYGSYMAPSSYMKPKQVKTISCPKRSINSKMLVIDAQANTTLSYEGLKFQGAPLKVIQCITRQHVSGMWNDDSLLAGTWNRDYLKRFQEVFGGKVTPEIFCTFIILKYVELHSDNEVKKVSLILRKAREFISAQPKVSLAQLQRLWKEEVKSPQ